MKKLSAAIAALLALSVVAGPAPGSVAAATSDTKATSLSTDWFSTTDGWNTDRIRYTNDPAELPVGSWDFQYMNSFAGVPTPPGAGWNTWDTVAKPKKAADWTGSHYSKPYPHADTTAAGSFDKNWAYLELYQALIGTGFYAKKATYSQAYAKVAADSPAVAETRITDPWTGSAPKGASDWSVGVNYSEFGSPGSAQAAVSTQPNGQIMAQYQITVTPKSGAPMTYNLLTVTLSSNGTASVTSDLNGNNAAMTGLLISGLNGVLMLNTTSGSTIVSPTQATAALNARHSPLTGWNLNPNHYTIKSFQPDNPTDYDSVFTLYLTAFFDPSTTKVTIAPINEADSNSSSAP